MPVLKLGLSENFWKSIFFEKKISKKKPYVFFLFERPCVLRSTRPGSQARRHAGTQARRQLRTHARAHVRRHNRKPLCNPIVKTLRTPHCENLQNLCWKTMWKPSWKFRDNFCKDFSLAKIFTKFSRKVFTVFFKQRFWRFSQGFSQGFSRWGFTRDFAIGINWF